MGNSGKKKDRKEKEKRKSENGKRTASEAKSESPTLEKNDEKVEVVFEDTGSSPQLKKLKNEKTGGLIIKRTENNISANRESSIARKGCGEVSLEPKTTEGKNEEGNKNLEVNVMRETGRKQDIKQPNEGTPC